MSASVVGEWGGGVERRCAAGSSLSLSLAPVGDAGSTVGGNFSTRPATDVCLRSEAPAEAARELFALRG